MKQSRNAIIAVSLMLAVAQCSRNDETPSPPQVIQSQADQSNTTLTQILTAEMAISHNQYPLATTIYMNLANIQHDPELAHRAVQIAVGASDLSIALKAATLWVKLNPHNPVSQFSLGAVALQTGNFSLAFLSAQEALRLKPHWIDAIALQSQIFIAEQKSEEAIRYLSTQLKEQPDDDRLRSVYADTLVSLKKFPAAQQEFERLAHKPHYYGYANLNLGKIMLENNNLTQATRYLKLSSKDPDYFDPSQFLLAAIAEQQKQYPQALEYYLSINKGPLFVNAQIRVALLIAEEGDLPKAMSFLTSISTNTDLESKQLAIAKTTILLLYKKFSEAYDVISSALSTFPNDFEVLAIHSSVAMQLEKLDQVEKDLRKLILQQPDNLEIINALATTLTEYSHDYGEANQYLIHGLTLAPNNPELLNSMGWLQYRLQHYNEAIDYLKKAWQISQDSKVATRLGVVLWVMGDQQGAVKIWQDGLKKNPDDPLLLETIKQFKP